MSAAKEPAPVVHGFVASGFEAVAAAFENNFTEHGELGGAFAAYHDGRRVVDIWAGVADRATSRPWTQETVQGVFSGTKAFAAVCLLKLIERGTLKLDAPIVRYWVEFGAAGKQSIPVDYIVTHRAGLSGFREPLGIADMTDIKRLTRLLAAQAPLIAPGIFCYHPVTYGILCGELVRHIDGRSIGRFFAEEVAAPLGLDLWIGLPRMLEARVATLELAPDWGRTAGIEKAMSGADPLASLTWANPALFDAQLWPWNLASYHAAEMPGVGGIGAARSIARLFGCLARGGEIDGIRILTAESVALGTRERVRAVDPVAGREMAHGVGFALPTSLVSYGPPADAFGHRGAGGSMHGAWPGARVGFSYCPNLMIDRWPNDARAEALLGALHSAVTE